MNALHFYMNLFCLSLTEDVRPHSQKTHRRPCGFSHYIVTGRAEYIYKHRLYAGAFESTRSPSLFPTSPTTHHTSSFSPKCLLRFAKRCCLSSTLFLICCNETSCPMAKTGGSGKGPSLIGLQTVAACAISVACSITMEPFRWDLKVIWMSLCELQSLSRVTLIRCEVTTRDLYDLNRLSFLIWSVWSEIFKSMFKGSAHPSSSHLPPKFSLHWWAYEHMLTTSPIRQSTCSIDIVDGHVWKSHLNIAF